MGESGLWRSEGGPVLTKKYLSLRFNTGGARGNELARSYKVGTCSVVLLTPDREVAARYLDHPTGAQVAEGIIAVPELAAGHEQLTALKTKGITKANGEQVAAALKKIGVVTSEKAQVTILPFAKDDTAPEAVQRGAILALAKQPATAKELVGFLTDKRFPIKSAAQTTLTAMGLPGLPGMLDGLDAESAEARAAAFGPAAAVTKNGKVARDVGFWKTGKADDRAKALTEWRAWADEKLKPKPKDPPAKGKEPPPKKK